MPPPNTVLVRRPKLRALSRLEVGNTPTRAPYVLVLLTISFWLSGIFYHKPWQSPNAHKGHASLREPPTGRRPRRRRRCNQRTAKLRVSLDLKWVMLPHATGADQKHTRTRAGQGPKGQPGESKQQPGETGVTTPAKTPKAKPSGEARVPAGLGFV
jgi:hypothetical protein